MSYPRSRAARSPNAPVFSRSNGETSDGTFEIWFFVLFVPSQNRGFWFRYELTRVRGANAVGVVWAAAFRAHETARYGKRIVDRASCALDDSADATSPFDISFGDAGRVRDGALEGSVRDITWSLSFDRADAPSQRTPALFARLPLPTHAVHSHTEVPFFGTIRVGGEEDIVLQRGDALGTQVHLWGTERPDAIRWIYANGFDRVAGKGRAAVVEVSSIRPKRVAPPVTFGTLSSPRVEISAASLLSRVRATDRGIVACSKTKEHVLLTRAHADPKTFASYVYRDPKSGHDLYVSQSDVGHVDVEAFERVGIGRVRPVYRKAMTPAAIELHQRTPIAGHRYIEWHDEVPPIEAQRRHEPVHRRRPSPPGGSFDDLPSTPRRIFAAGLTYEEHARETASASALVLFDKAPGAWLVPSSKDVDRVICPDATSVARALDVIEPGLGATLLDRWNGLIPPLLDYEVELGFLLLEDVDASMLDDPNARIRGGWFLANDLTARTCQVLGEDASIDQAGRLRFWSCAKSFAGFCPVTRTMFVPNEPIALDAPPPSVTLRTHVRGELRQRTSTSSLAVSLRAMLRAALRGTGGLGFHDALLTGTPSGIAFRVSALKRAIGARIFDRFSRAEAALAMYASRPDAFLGIGDEVTVDGDFLGSRTIVID